MKGINFCMLDSKKYHKPFISITEADQELLCVRRITEILNDHVTNSCLVKKRVKGTKKNRVI